MRVFAIDTSTMVATACILEDEQVLCEYSLSHKWTHSKKLMPMILNMFLSCELTPKDIDVFSCAIGPGSFTGLRIGAATIKGFAQAEGKDVLGIPTLDALAYNLFGYSGYICPILDAQQGMVYSAIYKWEESKLTKLSDFSPILFEDLLDIINREYKEVVFIGDAVFIYKDKILENIEKAQIAPGAFIMPRASSVAHLASKLYKEGKSESYFSLKPYYIRKSQAELEYEKKHEIILDRMKDEDIDNICEIEKLCFKTPWSRQAFFDEQKNSLANYVVARDGNNCVGYGGMWLVVDEGHITNIAVHPTYQRLGIADKIVKRLFEIAKENNIKSLTLEVRPSNYGAIALYKKHGFFEAGRRKGYYEDTFEDAIIMWKNI